jgi:hypothetical protein
MAKGDRLKKAEEKWQQLIAALDAQLQPFKRNRYAMGRILYEIKVLLKKQCWDKGRNGRWKPLLDEKKLSVSTANDLVRDYEKMENLPAHKRFFAQRKPAKSHNNRKKKSAVSAPLAKIVAASEVDPKKADDSDDHRTAVECVFVLTSCERKAFMRAVRKMGELRATEVIFRAVVTEGKESEKAVGARA